MKKVISAVVNMFVVISLLTSCGATKSLWREPKPSDEIRQFLMTEGGDNVIIIGQKYHYIFAVDQNLKNILNWKYRNNLRPKFWNFAAKNDSTITGHYSLSIPMSQLPSEESWLKNNGFKLNPHNKMEWIYTGRVEGNRYLADKQISLPHEFTKPYKINISEELSGLQKVPRIAATPITVTVDGIAMVSFVGAIVTAGIIWCTTNKCSSK